MWKPLEVVLNIQNKDRRCVVCYVFKHRLKFNLDAVPKTSYCRLLSDSYDARWGGEATSDWGVAMGSVSETGGGAPRDQGTWVNIFSMFQNPIGIWSDTTLDWRGRTATCGLRMSSKILCCVGFECEDPHWVSVMRSEKRWQTNKGNFPSWGLSGLCSNSIHGVFSEPEIPPLVDLALFFRESWRATRKLPPGFCCIGTRRSRQQKRRSVSWELPCWSWSRTGL